MPIRGEWLLMLVGSSPAASAAAFMRRLIVLGERSNMRSRESAFGGRMALTACAVNSEMGANAPLPVWSVLDRRILTTWSPLGDASTSPQVSARSSLQRRAASWASVIMAMSMEPRRWACPGISNRPPGWLRLGVRADATMHWMCSHRKGAACRGVLPFATCSRFSPARKLRTRVSWAGLGPENWTCRLVTDAR